MTENTAISWATHTFNPWVGCTKVSPGCDNCYAETLTKRMGQDVWGAGKPRRRTTPAYWKKAHKWAEESYRSGIRPRVFPSMCDPFDAEVDDAWREDFFELIDMTPRVDWLLLTKRPNLITKKIPDAWKLYPPKNVWYGTSIESNAQMWRGEALVEVPAHVRFLSLEPLLESIRDELQVVFSIPGSRYPASEIDWAIVGGESGGKRRGMAVEWADEIRQLCEDSGVAFFFKQVSALRPGQGEDALGGVYHNFPVVLK
jgi:protein gp37